MKAVNIAKLKDQLSEHLRAVERGATVVVTDRGRPVAQLSPIMSEEGIEVIPAMRPFSAVRRRKFSPTRLHFDSLAFLAAERSTR